MREGTLNDPISPKPRPITAADVGEMLGAISRDLAPESLEPEDKTYLIAARALYEEAQDVWFEAIDSLRSTEPASVAAVEAAYVRTQEAMEKHERATRYLDGIIEALGK
jgi:hypothetical protein